MSDDHARLAPAAQLFGELLLVELDAARLAQLSRPDVAEALRELGVQLPSADAIDEVAAEFAECFLQPESHPPPVQSLWADGGYEGDAAVAIRKLADAAGLEADLEVARHAPVDHVGMILLLWCRTREDRADVAERVVADHMAWIVPALTPVAEREGFYSGVARAVIDLVGQLTGS